MTGRPSLGDELALELLAHGPTAGTELARLVARRRVDVVATLEADWRFERVGGGRGTRWRLAPSLWDEKGRILTQGRRESITPPLDARLAALEARVAEHERRLDGVAATGYRRRAPEEAPEAGRANGRAPDSTITYVGGDDRA